MFNYQALVQMKLRKVQTRSILLPTLTNNSNKKIIANNRNFPLSMPSPASNIRLST